MVAEGRVGVGCPARVAWFTLLGGKFGVEASSRRLVADEPVVEADEAVVEAEGVDEVCWQPS